MVKKSIGIIGFPQDIGASRRGVDMGPYALRAEGLELVLEKLGFQVRDYGNIPCRSMEDIEDGPEHYRGEAKLRHLAPILHNLLLLKDRVAKVVEDGRTPLCIGGDHSMAIGSLAGACSGQNQKRGLLWIDAHGDFNTPKTTPTGNIHGMPLAVVTGHADKRLLEIGPFPVIEEVHTAVFGVRDLDPPELEALKASKITTYSMRRIMREGFAKSIANAIDVACSGTEGFHLSFDMDSIDPIFSPGTGTAVPGGLTNREALYLMEEVAASGKLLSVDLVEVNPALDQHNRTGLFAVELLARAFGKRTSF